MTAVLELHWDRRRLRRGALLMAAIGAGGVILFTQDDPSAYWLGGAWIAAFAALALAILGRGRRSGPVVTINAEGIHDRRISASALAWDAISRVEGFDVEHVSFVGLDFHDATTALARAKPMVRFFAPLHRLLRLPAVSINTSLLDGSDADLLAAIARWRPELARPGA